MERYIVGKCRNGKIITSQPVSDGLESTEEIFDAIVMLDFLAAREFRKNGNSDVLKSLEDQLANLTEILDVESSYAEQMAMVGAKTSLHLRRYAQSLLAQEFKD